MKHLNATAGIVTVIFFAWAGALIAVSAKPSPRPQPVMVRTFSLEEFVTATTGTPTQTITFVPNCSPEEIDFGQKVSGAMFIKDVETVICCAVSGRNESYYCSTDDGDSGVAWGLGVGPSPRITHCEISGGSVSSISYYRIEP